MIKESAQPQTDLLAKTFLIAPARQIEEIVGEEGIAAALQKIELNLLAFVLPVK